jgi:hypothetical protein
MSPALHGLAPDPATEYSPEAVILDRVSDAELALSTCAEPVFEEPMATSPKFSAAGEKANGFVDGPPVALPERLTDCGL